MLDFDTIGYDLISIYLESYVAIHGHLLESHLEVRTFKYKPVADNAYKLDQAVR